MLNIAIVLPEKLFLKKSLPDIYSTNSTEFLFKYNYNLALVLLWLVRKWHFSKNLHKRGRNRFEHLLNCKQGINRQNYYIWLGLKASIFFCFVLVFPFSSLSVERCLLYIHWVYWNSFLFSEGVIAGALFSFFFEIVFCVFNWKSNDNHRP